MLPVAVILLDAVSVTKLDVPDVEVTLPATSPVKSPINVLATKSSPCTVHLSSDSSHSSETFGAVLLPLLTSIPAFALGAAPE